MRSVDAKAPVPPSRYRRGAAAKTWLLAQIEKKRAAPASDVNQKFTENIAFYLKLGYRVDREEDVGDGTIKIDMSKTVGRQFSKQ